MQFYWKFQLFIKWSVLLFKEKKTFKKFKQAKLQTKLKGFTKMSKFL